MKNTINLNPRLISNRDTDKSAVKCTNLRLINNGRKTLRVVGTPNKILRSTLDPLLVFTPVNKSCNLLIIRNNRTIFVKSLPDGDSIELYTFDSDITGAFACADQVVINTGDGTYRADYDSESDELLTPVKDEDYRAVTLRAVDAGTYQQTVGSRQLSKVYNSDFTPIDTDRRKMTNDLATAYATIAKDACLNDVFLQPALCRYRLRDDCGRELFTSPPVLLSASDGQQLTSPITVGSDDRQTLDAYTIYANAWQLQLDIASGCRSSDSRVATLEVLMSPQLHPYDSSAAPLITFSRRDNSRDFLKMVLPGEPLTAAKLSQLTARMDLMERVVATISRPFDGNISSASVVARNPLSMSDDIAKVKTTLRRDVRRIDTVTSRLLPPHRFAAEVASTASGVTLWGNIKALRYDGYPLGIFTAQVANRTWRAAIKVEFDDGTEVAVWQGQGTTGCPTAINPVLTYPSADAVKMTIMLSASGQSPQEQTFELSPDESGTCARYINPTLKPFALNISQQAFVIPSANAITYDLPQVLIATDAAQPLVAKTITRTDSGAIRAIIPAHVGQNAWDFGRSRFYVMADHGINSVSVNAKRTYISVNLIDRRGVEDTDSAVVADDEVIVAATNGDLLALKSSRISTLRADTGYRRLAWVADRRELWGIDSDGTVEVICFDFDLDRYDRSDIVITKVLNYSSGALAQTNLGLADLYDEISQRTQHITWSITATPTDTDIFTPGMLRLDMAAMRFDGTVTFSRIGLTTEPPAPDLSSKIVGELLSPISLLPRSRPMRSLRLTISADVTSDFTIAPSSLQIS